MNVRVFGESEKQKKRVSKDREKVKKTSAKTIKQACFFFGVGKERTAEGVVDD